jgi:hypothetical protein
LLSFRIVTDASSCTWQAPMRNGYNMVDSSSCLQAVKDQRRDLETPCRILRTVLKGCVTVGNISLGIFCNSQWLVKTSLLPLEDFTGFANWSQPTRCPVPGRILNLSHCLTVACLCYITSSPEAYSSAYHSSRIIKSNTYLFKTLRRGIAVV